ncbi:hypothetical protein HMPREF1555_01456 [Porphyromonas gingivalis F0570]|uniref:Uncharacterized protein n=1 Tax=Porphyromonas gingivalis F0570 TaxID=1227271 RepID=A0A0E2LPP2_PORGN|nr:hypothetical protein HMPREF1555_01456 [Porphyromonas gingivalis F0570]ERJ68915.1 hypothetical protein HMPREF1553_00814 [Porphyromonas gingivalis F0568]
MMTGKRHFHEIERINKYLLSLKRLFPSHIKNTSLQSNSNGSILRRLSPEVYWLISSMQQYFYISLSRFS